ncbi:hypothetical protein LVD15_06115 [Fulvivirga maritima]|uniref:DUF6702 family protein n=1 Tax=Fulvivirga maritima TaxID=2904247 RepID=UPI001F282667|nr:DUF6702 family protein [Fulvivirga maritima]UII27996.1 hypothetical protein LVD15_06115 [Fulvivirga maritima]
MLKYFMLVVVFFGSEWFHPMHVSVCEINFNQKNHSLEFTHHIFIDDWEKSFRQSLKEPFLDITNPGKGRKTDDLLEEYLKNRFKVTVNGKEVLPKYLGHEVENDAIYCYLQLDGVDQLKSVRVFNSILTEVYDDQVNLVHVEQGDDIKSMKFTSESKIDELKF